MDGETPRVDARAARLLGADELVDRARECLGLVETTEPEWTASVEAARRLFTYIATRQKAAKGEQ